MDSNNLPLRPLRPRAGSGYDVHCLVEDRPLILGGVEIPSDRGLDGHSDADVLCHAIMDALLGAAGERDIGHHFPNTDPSLAGISSLTLLERVGKILHERGYEIGNIDATVIAEAPKIAPHLALMRERLGRALGLNPQDIGIKATTNEQLGFVGRGEGIAALATALIFPR